jgi:hypothetical protein
MKFCAIFSSVVFPNAVTFFPWFAAATTLLYVTLRCEYRLILKGRHAVSSGSPTDEHGKTANDEASEKLASNLNNRCLYRLK